MFWLGFFAGMSAALTGTVMILGYAVSRRREWFNKYSKDQKKKSEQSRPMKVSREK